MNFSLCGPPWPITKSISCTPLRGPSSNGQGKRGSTFPVRAPDRATLPIFCRDPADGGFRAAEGDGQIAGRARARDLRTRPPVGINTSSSHGEGRGTTSRSRGCGIWPAGIEDLARDSGGPLERAFVASHRSDHSGACSPSCSRRCPKRAGSIARASSTSRRSAARPESVRKAA